MNRKQSVALPGLCLAALLACLPAFAAAANDADEGGSRVKAALQKQARERKGGEEALTIEEPDKAAAAESSAELGQGQDAGEPGADGNPEAKAKAPRGCWWRGGKWEGELQFRYSAARDRQADPQTTSLGRDLGLHLGYTASPRKDWDLHLALNTGRNNRPLSAYVPSDKLDSAHFLFFNEYWSRQQWKAGRRGQFEGQFGRFAYPFDMSQLVYDNDLRLPGAYLEYSREYGPEAADGDDSAAECAQPAAAVYRGLTRFGVSLYGAELVSGDLPAAAVAAIHDGPTRLASLRLDWRFALAGDARLDAALSYHDFTNVDSLGYRVAVGDWRAGGQSGKGETTNYSAVTGALESDFNLLHARLAAQFGRGSRWPFELEAEAVKNLGAADEGAGQDFGWYAGASCGSADPGAWEFGLSRAHINSDAVLAAVNRGEYGTNVENTRLQIRYTPELRIAGGQLSLRAALSQSKALDAAAPGGDFSQRLVQLYTSLEW